MLFKYRYIRLTGVYAIIIGLHATLLKYFATGPQSHMVSSMVTKCTNGQWHVDCVCTLTRRGEYREIPA